MPLKKNSCRLNRRPISICRINVRYSSLSRCFPAVWADRLALLAHPVEVDRENLRRSRDERGMGALCDTRAFGAARLYALRVGIRRRWIEFWRRQRDFLHRMAYRDDLLAVRLFLPAGRLADTGCSGSSGSSAAPVGVSLPASARQYGMAGLQGVHFDCHTSG